MTLPIRNEAAVARQLSLSTACLSRSQGLRTRQTANGSPYSTGFRGALAVILLKRERTRRRNCRVSRRTTAPRPLGFTREQATYPSPDASDKRRSADRARRRAGGTLSREHGAAYRPDERSRSRPLPARSTSKALLSRLRDDPAPRYRSQRIHFRAGVDTRERIDNTYRLRWLGSRDGFLRLTYGDPEKAE
jgi:hypothetical protein